MGKVTGIILASLLTAGAMLTAMTAVEGSAAYVAIEEVRGTLQGRTHSYTLDYSLPESP